MSGPASCTVWWAPIESARSSLTQILDADERARLARFRRDDDADRHLVGAALSRIVAADQLGCEPHEVSVERRCHRCGEGHGRPTIAGIEHSVSHAGRWIAVAVATHGRVGVDVESVVESSTVERVAPRVLTRPEFETLRAVNPVERRGAFTTLWTRKEALLKASGHGLTRPLNDIEVSSSRSPAGVVSWKRSPAAPRAIQLVDLRPRGRYRAAAAVLDAEHLSVTELDAVPLMTRVGQALETSNEFGPALRQWISTCTSVGPPKGARESVSLAGQR